MSNGHAPFPPSAAKRWMTCTASFSLGLQVPEERESEYAAEGTRLHDLANLYLLGKDAMSPEDHATLRPYLDYAGKRMKKAKVVRIEEHLQHSQLLGGTADLIMIFDEPQGGLLEVVDLKSGAGILVYPEENAQMLTYAFMTVMQQMQLGNSVPENILLTIVQPPDEERPVKSWATTLARVIAHGALVEAAIQTAIEGRGTLVPGDHCRFCKAKAICPALRGDMTQALAAALPSTMTVASLANWLDRADRVEQFIKAVRETGHDVATLAARQGKPGIPGWVLKPKRATRSWADEEAVLAIARKRKIKIWQDKLLSPAMAEKAHPSLPEELTAQIVSVSSGMNLVRGEAPGEVSEAKDGSKMERLMANFELMKHRR